MRPMRVGKRKVRRQGVASMLPRKLRFVAEYLLDLNAAAAARRAGYSRRRADVTGSELLRDPEVQELLADLRGELVARARLNRDRIVAELHRVAFDLGQPAAARVRALELLLRIAGVLVDRHEVHAAGSIDVGAITGARDRIRLRIGRLSLGAGLRTEPTGEAE